MVGLRSREESRFIAFFKLVQESAADKNAVFFLDCVEGNDLWTDDIICTDCSGWLIPNDKVEEFKKEYENFKSLEKWEDYVVWVTWSGNSTHPKINIELL